MTTQKQWREAVRRSDAPPQVKLLCDYLSERMWQGRGRYNGIPRMVSVPRPIMAQELGAPERTVDRWVSQAVKAGVLTVVRKGREGRTAEYQGLMPATRRENGETTGESYADLRTSEDEASNTSQRSGLIRRSAHLDPRNDGGELRRSAHPIVTDHSGRADGLGQALVEPDSPELEETFAPDDRAESSGTPVDHRATGPAEVLGQRQQQRRSVQLPKPTPRQPPAGRSSRAAAHLPVAADSADVTTRGEQAS